MARWVNRSQLNRIFRERWRRVCGSCVRAHRSSPVPAASLCAAWPSRLLLCAEGSHALMRWSMRRRPPWSWRDHSAGCLHWSSPTALPSVCCLPAQNCIDRQRGARRRVGARVHPRQLPRGPGDPGSLAGWPLRVSGGCASRPQARRSAQRARILAFLTLPAMQRSCPVPPELLPQCAYSIATGGDRERG